MNEMTNQYQPETAVGMLAEATLQAAVQIAIVKGLYKVTDNPTKKENFSRKLSEALKSTTKDNLDRVMEEWKEATEANLNNAWLKQLMVTQAAELAQIAISKIN
jgi:hypothetical protein